MTPEQKLLKELVEVYEECNRKHGPLPLTYDDAGQVKDNMIWVPVKLLVKAKELL